MTTTTTTTTTTTNPVRFFRCILFVAVFVRCRSEETNACLTSKFCTENKQKDGEGKVFDSEGCCKDPNVEAPHCIRTCKECTDLKGECLGENGSSKKAGANRATLDAVVVVLVVVGRVFVDRMIRFV